MIPDKTSKISMHKTNRYGDIGDPCLTPHDNSEWFGCPPVTNKEAFNISVK